MKEKKNQKTLQKAGTSMIEVLVAFLVVMFMIGMFTKVLIVSVKMLQRSQDHIAKAEAFNEAYYLTENIEERVKEDDTLILKSKDGEISMELSKGKLQYHDDSTGLRRYSFYTETQNNASGD